MTADSKQPRERYDRRFLARLVRDSLLREIMPLMSPGREKQILETSCALLDYVTADGPPYPGYEPLPQTLMEAAEPLLEAAGVSGAAAGLSHEEEVLAGLAGICSRPGGEAAREVLRQVLEHETLRCREVPSIQQAYAYSGSGAIVNPPAELKNTETLLADYFKQRPDLLHGGSVEKVRRVAAGLSKQTFHVALRDTSDGTGGVIVRMDPTYSSLETTVADEFPLLRELNRRGLQATPRALAFEPDPGPCGAPFMVMAVAPGTSDFNQWGGSEAVRGVAIQLAEFMADLHNLPLDGAFAENPAWLAPDHLCRSVDGLVNAWRRFKTGPEPLMEGVMAWLKANQPEVGAKKVLVHGDAGLHNLLVHEGKLSAVLDWEITHLGDPGEDLAYARPFIEPFIEWDDFLAAYRARGGPELTADHSQFYAVIAFARVAMSVESTVHGLQVEDPRLNPTLAYVGMNFQKRLMLETFRRVVAP